MPAVLGLLLYGLGGLMLANWLPTKRREAQDWRTAGATVASGRSEPRDREHRTEA